MIVRTATDRPDVYAGMGRFIPASRLGLGGLGDDGFDFQGEGDVGTSLNIDPELYPTDSLPTGVFTVDNSSGEFTGWSNGASSGSMLPSGTGVTQDANGNWLDASGKPTNFNSSGSPFSPGSLSPGSISYNPGVLSNLFNALAITTPSIIASVNGAAIANAAQCKTAGGNWTGTSCVRNTMNTNMLLMYGLGFAALVLLASEKKGR